MEKNQEFTVTIEDMNEDGAGVGKLAGYIWFIKDTVIGDVVRAKAMKMKKSYGFARLMEVLEPSAGRVEPSCPVARQCGGCQLQAMSYEEQLRFKENKVLNNLMRIGKFKRDEIQMLPIMGNCTMWIMEQPAVRLKNYWEGRLRKNHIRYRRKKWNRRFRKYHRQKRQE